MADLVLDEFSLVASDLQSMIAKINSYQIQIRNEKTATQFMCLKEAFGISH